MSPVAARPRRCRSFVLLAVLVIVGASLLVATSLLFVAQTELAVSSGAGEAAQSRALAWSGLRAAMAQLNDQHSRILAGQTPKLGSEFVIYEAEPRQGVARLLSVSGISSEPTLIAEAGKIDVNRAKAEAVAATGRATAETAHAIFDHAQTCGGRVQSVNELMRVSGGVVSMDVLSGSLGEIAGIPDAPITAVISTGDGTGPCIRGLADVLTVFTNEPLMQQDGSPRINLNAPWSNELAGQIEKRFDTDVAQQVQAAFERGAKFETDSAIVASLRQQNVKLEDWPAVLDAFCTQIETHRAGRLDINTASYESLLSLPGLTAEQAAQMVRVRPGLDDRERASVAWPVLQQIVSPEQFEILVDHITTRCWAWRVRIAGGEVTADQPDQWLGHPVVYEAVIDLSDSQPRVAYLRDITVLEETLAIAAASTSRSTGVDDRASDTPGPSIDTPATNDSRSSDVEEPPAPPPPSDEPRIGRWHGR